MSRHLSAARARLVASLLAVSGLVTACGTSTGLVDAAAPPGERPSTEPAVWPEGVETFEVSSNRHVEGDIDYDRSPPAGGDHSNVWQNCGIYDEPVEDGQAVHSLEHGAVWITYRPDLPDEQVQRLHDLVGSGGYVLLSPYEGLDSPIALSAWGVQLKLDDAADERAERFVTEYANGPQTMEPGAPCTGGVGVPLGSSAA
jgi:hypothetical protein